VNQYHQKVGSTHLKRDAYLYIRQSTLKQVYENTESTERQYGLRQRAVSLGWSIEQVIIIDEDQGKSGAATDRKGFQKLVAEVGMGRVGIVMGLEVSRLARNNTEWHRLLEICALTHTLILDEQGVYDPIGMNDRMLLGLKGALSEAELHLIKSRLQGGILNKALKGELKTPLPVGLVYNHRDKVILDPDKQVQSSINLFFETFRRCGSACSVVKIFNKKGLKFPRRLQKGSNKGDIVWGELDHARALDVLHNKRYAGIFSYGKTRIRTCADGKKVREKLPKEQWIAYKENAHPGYITVEEHEKNIQRLQENAQTQGEDRKKSPPREGPALLQGLVLCGICGRRMTVRYHQRRLGLLPNYRCQKTAVENAKPMCQDITGACIDEAVGELLLQAVNPLALKVALKVQDEIQSRLQEADQLRKQQVERARYEADMAKRRYMSTDPDNRLVIDILEAEWNEKLRALDEAQQEYERQSQADQSLLNEKYKEQIFSLVTDFPKLWKNPNTPDRERKRMVRLLIEDVTLIKKGEITVHIRFKGGKLKTLTLPIPLPAPESRKTDPTIIAEIDLLLDHYTDDKIAKILNERGLKPVDSACFTKLHVWRLRHAYKLRSRHDRLREIGMLTLQEVCKELNASRSTVLTWRKKGLLKAHRYDARRGYLYEPLTYELPEKYAHQKEKRKKF